MFHLAHKWIDYIMKKKIASYTHFFSIYKMHKYFEILNYPFSCTEFELTCSLLITADLFNDSNSLLISMLSISLLVQNRIVKTFIHPIHVVMYIHYSKNMLKKMYKITSGIQSLSFLNFDCFSRTFSLNLRVLKATT